MDMTEESLLDRHIHLHTHELLPGRWLRPRRSTLLITHRFKEASLWPIIHRKRTKRPSGEFKPVTLHHRTSRSESEEERKGRLDP